MHAAMDQTAHLPSRACAFNPARASAWHHLGRWTRVAMHSWRWSQEHFAAHSWSEARDWRLSAEDRGRLHRWCVSECHNKPSCCGFPKRWYQWTCMGWRPETSTRSWQIDSTCADGRGLVGCHLWSLESCMACYHQGGPGCGRGGGRYWQGCQSHCHRWFFIPEAFWFGIHVMELRSKHQASEEQEYRPGSWPSIKSCLWVAWTSEHWSMLHTGNSLSKRQSCWSCEADQHHLDPGFRRSFGQAFVPCVVWTLKREK